MNHCWKREAAFGDQSVEKLKSSSQCLAMPSPFSPLRSSVQEEVDLVFSGGHSQDTNVLNKTVAFSVNVQAETRTF